MNRHLILTFLSFTLFFTSIISPDVLAVTAEDRLVDVERQLQAIAEQIRKYEGDRTELEKQILANDEALKEVNAELLEVQKKLQYAENALYT